MNFWNNRLFVLVGAACAVLGGCFSATSTIKPLPPLPPLSEESAQHSVEASPETPQPDRLSESAGVEEQTLEPPAPSAEASTTPNPSSAEAQSNTDNTSGAQSAAESPPLGPSTIPSATATPGSDTSTATPSDEKTSASEPPSKPKTTPNSAGERETVSGSETSYPQAGESSSAEATSNPALATAAPGRSTEESLVGGPSASSGGPSGSATEVALLSAVSDFSADHDLSNRSLSGLISDSLPAAKAASMRMVEQARVRLKANDISGAMRLLSRAISIDPTDSYAYFYLGRAYLAKKDAKQALTFFQRAALGFAANPQWLAETQAFEGCAQELLGNVAEARQAYKSALAQAPDNYVAQLGYARVASVEGGTEVSTPDVAPESGSTSLGSPNEVQDDPAASSDNIGQ